MIWLRTALSTEILPAIVASNPILRHMLCSLHWNWLSFIIFLTHLYFAWDHLHHISTLTTNQIRIVFDKVHELSFINFLLVFLRNKLFAFVISDLFIATWAANWFWFGHLFNNFFTEAVHMDLMETISGLQHIQVLVQLIVFADELVTKHAKTLLSQLLHLLINGCGPLFLMRVQKCVHIICLDVSTLKAAALTHTFEIFYRSLGKQLLRHGLVHYLHWIVFVLLEFVKGILLLWRSRLNLLSKCAASSTSCGRLWYVHTKNSS